MRNPRHFLYSDKDRDLIRARFRLVNLHCIFYYYLLSRQNKHIKLMHKNFDSDSHFLDLFGKSVERTRVI